VVSSARRVTPGERARRTLIFDLLVAIGLAALAFNIAAGLGVIGFFGLPLLLVGLLWIGAEGQLRRHRRTGRRGSRG
jgi:ABC-type multidrug transport system fused ATPase/permease subunit